MMLSSDTAFYYSVLVSVRHCKLNMPTLNRLQMSLMWITAVIDDSTYLVPSTKICQTDEWCCMI